MPGPRRAFLLATLVLLAAPVLADEASAWAALRAGGHVALVRARSREASRSLGERFRREGVVVDKVYSSPWCRCRDTAIEAFGKAEDWGALASFVDEPQRGPGLTERVRQRIGGYSTRRPKGTVVMVTHKGNIEALTRLSVDAGEIVVVRPDGCCGLRVVGRTAIR